MGGVERILRDPIGEIQQAFHAPFSSNSLTNLGNNLMNFGTRGLLGWGPNGLEAGEGAKAAWQVVDEGIGEVSGRNLAREEAAKAEQRFQEEQRNREQMTADERALRGRMDMAASMAARSARGMAGSGSSGRMMGSAGGMINNAVNQGNLLGL